MALAGKVALITGGSKGIGAALAQRLVTSGATVAINYSSDSSAADKLVSSLGADKAIAIKADASDVSQIDSLVKQTVDKFGKIDILVPCAGVLPMKGVENATPEDFDKTYNLNVKGPFFLAQKSIPHMAPGGRIVFISTSQCHNAAVTGSYTLYISTKGAIEQVTRGLAKDMAPKGITVNCVAPGPTATELFMRGKPAALIDTIAGFSPFKRLGKPEEIAAAIAHLVSPDSSWISGQLVKVNGAMV